MKKQLNIHGINFELEHSINCVPRISTRNLDECYERPSDTKKAIWNEWVHWFVYDCETTYFGVASYSSNFFSIEGVIEFEGKSYYLRITKAHNRACEIIQ